MGAPGLGPPWGGRNPKHRAHHLPHRSESTRRTLGLSESGKISGFQCGCQQADFRRRNQRQAEKTVTKRKLKEKHLVVSPVRVLGQTIARWEAAGALFIIASGSALHFVYAWSGYSLVVGFFGAVNESIWEHLKLAFWPTIAWGCCEYLAMPACRHGLAWSKASGVIAMMLSIITGAWVIERCLGGHELALDIGLFVLAVLLGQTVSALWLAREHRAFGHRARGDREEEAANLGRVSQSVGDQAALPRRSSSLLQWMGVVILVCLAAAFIGFTVAPPPIELFRDSVSGEFGIPPRR